MIMKRILYLSFLLLGAYAFGLQAQDVAKPIEAANPDADIPRVVLDFGKPYKLNLGVNGMAMGGNTACGEDGSIFLEVYVPDSRNGMVLHSLAPDGKIVRFNPGNIQGYKFIGMPTRFFADETHIAALVDAQPEKASPQDKWPPPVQLALIYDRQGVFQKAVRLPDGFEASALGMYGSGNLLVVGANVSDKSAHLLVVSESGGIDREMRLFDEDYNLSPHAKEDQPLSSAPVFKAGALSSMRIIPYGQNLLLFPTATKQPIIEVNEHGIVHVYPLQIPKGFVLETLLSTDGHRWKVSTLSEQVETIKVKDSDSHSYAMKYGPIFEFDPADGTALRRIERPESASWAVLACEHDGEYAAFTTDAKDGSLELMKASVPK
jgi:hypothetical protein